MPDEVLRGLAPGLEVRVRTGTSVQGMCLRKPSMHHSGTTSVHRSKL